MNNVAFIILIAFLVAGATYIVNFISPKLRNIVAGAGTIYITYLLFFTSKIEGFTYKIGKFQIEWAATDYSFIFVLMISFLALIVLFYSFEFMKGKDRLGFYYFNLLLTIASMYGIVFSADFLSLFFFWEIMTWSSFLLVIYYRFEAQKAGIKYFIFSAIGAYAMLMAIVLLYSQVGSVNIEESVKAFPSISFGLQLAIITLLLVGFGVKSGLAPVHVWAPGAYSISPTPFTALFSGALSKMGIFGIGIVLFKFLDVTSFNFVYREIFAWLGAITALIATIYAVVQHDAKKLLAYSSISQLGYIVVGLAIGTELSVMAALFLAVIHAVFKGLLFLSVGSVFYRTGIRDLNELGGLIRKMPISFTAVLVSIITLAGFPPLAGFVAKWMLYESLIVSNHYFLVIIIFAGSTMAFLYVYRLIFLLFLGQERPEHKDIKEVPLLMSIPMVLLMLIPIVLGSFPGLLFEPIANAMGYLGFENVTWSMTSLSNVWGDKIELLTIAQTISTVFILTFIFLGLKGRKNTRYVTTMDIHTSGEIPTENENLTFQLDFFKPFERAVWPFLKNKLDDIYESFAKNLETFFDFLRFVYTGNGQTYALYVVIFTSVLLVFGKYIFS